MAAPARLISPAAAEAALRTPVTKEPCLLIWLNNELQSTYCEIKLLEFSTLRFGETVLPRQVRQHSSLVNSTRLFVTSAVVVKC